MAVYPSKSSLNSSIVNDLKPLIEEGALEFKLIDITDTLFAEINNKFNEATQNANLAWDSGVVYNTTDNKFAVYKERLFESKQDNNIGNEPPTTPNVNGDFENAYWKEVSEQAKAQIPEWQAGTYTGDLVIVYYQDHFYRLTASTPYESTDIIAEHNAGDWKYIPEATATQVEAENSDTGTANNSKTMSPLRVLQAFIYHIINAVISGLNTTANKIKTSINELEGRTAIYVYDTNATTSSNVIANEADLDTLLSNQTKPIELQLKTDATFTNTKNFPYGSKIKSVSWDRKTLTAGDQITGITNLESIKILSSSSNSIFVIDAASADVSFMTAHNCLIGGNLNIVFKIDQGADAGLVVTGISKISENSIFSISSGAAIYANDRTIIEKNIEKSGGSGINLYVNSVNTNINTTQRVITSIIDISDKLDDPTWTSASWGNSLSIFVNNKYNFYITIPSGTSDGPQVVDASSFSSWSNGKPILLKYINNDSSDQSVDWATGVKGVDSLSDPSGITANTEVSFTLVKDENGTLTVLSKQVYQTF